jgi:hypothetical protein
LRDPPREDFRDPPRPDDFRDDDFRELLFLVAMIRSPVLE